MNDEFRQMVIEALRRGEDLPAEWARELFPPEKREYELIYHGKKREEDILADTMAVPLQPVRTFGGNGDDWHNMLIFGDNLQAMKTLLQWKKDGMLVNADGSRGVKLVYIDPPFATKREFRGSQDERAYQDKVAGAQFLEFLRKRFVFIRELLTDDGFFIVHLDYRKKHYAKVLLDEVFGEHNFRNEAVVSRIKKSIRERERVKKLNEEFDTLLIYARSELALLLPPTKRVQRKERWHAFDAPETRTGMDYELFGHRPPPNRHWMYSEDLAKEMIKDGILRPNSRTGKPQYLIPASTEQLCNNLWTDITGYSFVWGYPTEKSEPLLARVIEMTTLKEDNILDAFAGSGTALVVAEKLGRRWIGIDCGKLAIYTIQKRMLSLKTEIGNKGKPLEPKPFTLYNAGLYDFSTLRQLSWEGWRTIALQLFECKDEPHTIGGLKLDGKRKGASVLVFNHLEHPGRRIDEDTVHDIHLAVGNKIGRKFCIIAPRATFDFQQDYIDFDGVRYYALRIPYSFINELHRREFSALQQPNDEKAVNDIVDAWGFDFIRPPQVEWSVGVEKRKGQSLEEAYLRVQKFESRAYLRGQDTRGGLETFSMLMLDLDYNGDVFDFDTVFYAHQLQDNDWQVWFPVESLGENIMVVFIDIYGNEAREIIPRNQFGLSPIKSASAKTEEKVED